MIKRILAILVIIALSVAATFFVMTRVDLSAPLAMLGLGDSSEDAEAAVVIADPLFAPMEPFTVTLRNNMDSLALYVSITLKVEDEATRKMLRNYMPEVRDRVLRTLVRQSIADVRSPSGSDILASRVRMALSQPFHPDADAPRIVDVLFTAYVVQ